tara:strand:- start:2382 stop:3536 length:1155 start_codon:yes stop_codon:yes gene_type:complete
MNYQPNFNDPRVIKRVNNAIGFTKAITSATKPKQLPTRLIDKHFGMQTHKLSKYLRNKLLRCVDDSYNMDTGQCKSYVFNTSGMSFLVEAVNQSSRVPVLSSGVINPVNDSFHNNIPIKEGHKPYTHHSVTQVYDQAMKWAKETYKEELETLEFQYEEKSSRDINPIQSIKNEVRKPLLAQYGLRHQYDVKACAPNILYQYSFMVPEATGVVLETLEHYLENSDAMRKKIAYETDIPLHQAKETITSLFSGAQISAYWNNSIMKRFNHDIAKVEFLKQHPYLTALRADIKEMWDPIKETVPKEYYITTTGKRRKRAFGPKIKWNIYFQLERKVMQCCYAYLNSKDNKYFNEHDGFTSQKEVNLDELRLFIKNNTGFNLTFEKKI